MDKILEQFRRHKASKAIVEQIHHLAREINSNINLMEVCGTHTVAIYRFGIRSLLPENVNMISGPGCPVCVSEIKYIDKAIELARDSENIICTFGDLMKVPGTKDSLQSIRAEGAEVRIVYSPQNALEVAEENPNKKVIFLAVGFETTAPALAKTIIYANEKKLDNFFYLTAIKTIPKPMEVLVLDPEVKLNGYLCPGHVSAIIGAKSYEFLTRKYKIPCVIAGFEPLDILYGILGLLKQLYNKTAFVENQYTRVVKWEGNLKAQKIINEVFEPCDANWRGIGNIPGTGLKLKGKYSKFDIENYVDFSNLESEEPKGCICGEILKGIKKPSDCPLMAKICTPDNPIGACMVSSEGACAAYYKYGRLN